MDSPTEPWALEKNVPLRRGAKDAVSPAAAALRGLGLGELLIDLTHLHGDDRLEETCAVLGARGLLQGLHGLGELGGRLPREARHGSLDARKLLLHAAHVDLTVHLNDSDSVAIPIVVVHLQCRTGRAIHRELLVQSDGRECTTLLLDQLDFEVGQSLVRGLVPQDHVRVGLLRVDVRREVWLALLDVCLHLLLSPTALRDIASHLPSKFHFVHDVDVDSEVECFANAIVHDGMQALNDHNLVGLDQLRGILEARVVVVDRLVDGLPRLQRRHLRIHELEIVLLRVQRCETCHLAAGTIVDVVVVQANHRHHVAHGGVTRRHLGAQGAEDASEESGLAATGVSCDADHDWRIRKGLRGRHNGRHALLPVVGGIHGDVAILLELGLRLRARPNQACAGATASTRSRHTAELLLSHCRLRSGRGCARRQESGLEPHKGEGRGQQRQERQHCGPSHP
mmetsp:Transcript_81113/g.180263  ORF Transcript_81113/g.180263 Transcript_81113/m.180263 type:complete len:454 (+) Transcript_81113:3-1364(+)